MKYFLLLALFFTIFSCSKHLSQSDRIDTIRHYGSLGGDTLHYHYDESGQISYINGSKLTYQYIYENNKITVRNTFENASLLESDSVNYDTSDNISRFIAHRFAYDTFPAEREQTDFTYQDHKLIAAQSNFVNQGVNYQVFAEYTWVGNDISKIILLYSPTDSTRIIFSYSQEANPYKKLGQQVWLLDPEFDFTRFDNLQRVAYLSSERRVVGSERYFLPNAFLPLTVVMEVNSDNNISMFQITPTDEGIFYNYQLK
jgi:hypothetical protein